MNIPSQRIPNALAVVTKALEELDAELARQGAGHGEVSQPVELEKFRQQLLAMKTESVDHLVNGLPSILLCLLPGRRAFGLVPALVELPGAQSAAPRGDQEEGGDGDP